MIVKNDVIIATGYNGSPRGDANCCDTGVCHRVGMQHNDGESVSRADAWKIAKAAGQVQGPETGILTSEDLY